MVPRMKEIARGEVRAKEVVVSSKLRIPTANVSRRRELPLLPTTMPLVVVVAANLLILPYPIRWRSHARCVAYGEYEY